MQINSPKVIAFHLPQFHPIPENDEWWGKGFTEWTNVAKAKPLFRGHQQPNVPADLGFYDLRLPEAREMQADYARRAGVYGFCYYHYWFGNGRRLLERPVDEILASGKPDFPFMLGWANQTWTGIWHGAKDRVLIEQQYPGLDDIKAHCRLLVRHFEDRRYISVDGRPLLYLYDPCSAGLTEEYVDRYKETFVREFKVEPVIIMRANGVSRSGIFSCADAVCLELFSGLRFRRDNSYLTKSWLSGEGEGAAQRTATSRSVLKKLLKRLKREQKPARVSFAEVVRHICAPSYESEQIPCILPNWDNTPRCGKDGWLIEDATPERFGQCLDTLFAARRQGPFKDLYFLKSWNEWAEGNYLEPDLRFGDAFLAVLREKIQRHAFR
jgi:hypothetical protein